MRRGELLAPRERRYAADSVSAMAARLIQLVILWDARSRTFMKPILCANASTALKTPLAIIMAAAVALAHLARPLRTVIELPKSDTARASVLINLSFEIRRVPARAALDLPAQRQHRFERDQIQEAIGVELQAPDGAHRVIGLLALARKWIRRDAPPLLWRDNGPFASRTAGGRGPVKWAILDVQPTRCAMSGRTTEHFVLCAQPCAHVFANLHGLFEGHRAPAAVLFWPALRRSK